MKAMTKGTRRSTFPISSMLTDGEPHKIKIDKFLKVGYKLVKEDGYTALLAYYPYGRAYVKLVTVEHGQATNTIVLTPKTLKALMKDIDLVFSKASRRTNNLSEAEADK